MHHLLADGAFICLYLASIVYTTCFYSLRFSIRNIWVTLP